MCLASERCCLGGGSFPLAWASLMIGLVPLNSLQRLRILLNRRKLCGNRPLFRAIPRYPLDIALLLLPV